VDFVNAGAQAAVFQVRAQSPAVAPRGYTLGEGRQVSDTWSLGGATSYAIEVSGPNGFARAFQGSVAAAGVVVRAEYDVEHYGVAVAIANHGSDAVTVRVRDMYTGEQQSGTVAAGKTLRSFVALSSLYGWYDLVVTVAEDPLFQQRLSGHLENGQPSITDPAIGGWGG
jgi:phospholipase C